MWWAEATLLAAYGHVADQWQCDSDSLSFEDPGPSRSLPPCRFLVAAIGRAGMITREFVKPGATLIDVGMNKVTDPAEFERLFKGNAKREESFRTKGSTLVGDVHPLAAEVAGKITPVPGGVGPLTIAMLMANTVKAAMMRRGSRMPALAAEHARSA